MKSISWDLNFQVQGWIEAVVFHIWFSSLWMGLIWTSETLDTKELVLHTPKVWLVSCLVSHRASIYKWNFALLLSQSLFFDSEFSELDEVYIFLITLVGFCFHEFVWSFLPLSPCFVTSFVQNLYHWADFAQGDL